MSIITSTVLSLEYGDYKVCYHRTEFGDCVSFSIGNITESIPVVRIHSACLFGEAMHSLHCDCGQQLNESFKAIKNHGAGVIVYTYAEGRGIGLQKKIEAMEIQRLGDLDTIQAFSRLGFDKSDFRSYGAEIAAMKDLDINNHILLISNNPSKIQSMKDASFVIDDIINIPISLNPYNSKELLVKKNKMGYYID